MRFAAFLRGINVGGHRVSAEQFKACFAELGFEEVATFRASGNVVFETKQRSRPKLTAHIEKGLKAELGYAVPTFLRSAADMDRIAGHTPFSPAAVTASKGKLQVLMLARKPSARARDDVLAQASADDLLAIDSTELYWLPKGGTLESDLDFKLVADALGVTTTRTKGTVELMNTKYFDG